METAITFVLNWAGYIGLGLSLLTALLWHRYVEPITFPWRIRMEYADVAKEQEAARQQRAEAVRWHLAQRPVVIDGGKVQRDRRAEDARIFALVKGKR